jgi:hypothetical protein
MLFILFVSTAAAINLPVTACSTREGGFAARKVPKIIPAPEICEPKRANEKLFDKRRRRQLYCLTL